MRGDADHPSRSAPPEPGILRHCNVAKAVVIRGMKLARDASRSPVPSVRTENCLGSVDQTRSRFRQIIQTWREGRGGIGA